MDDQENYNDSDATMMDYKYSDNNDEEGVFVDLLANSNKNASSSQTMQRQQQQHLPKEIQQPCKIKFVMFFKDGVSNRVSIR
mmetsp:Transcript_17579/g.38056  ORF Transcript_17579/g.38056 Transcript_17579/m.38056 type:complete len:82 (-) Transcript_17579:67-312(-)